MENYCFPFIGQSPAVQGLLLAASGRLSPGDHHRRSNDFHLRFFACCCSATSTTTTSDGICRPLLVRIIFIEVNYKFKN